MKDEEVKGLVEEFGLNADAEKWIRFKFMRKDVTGSSLEKLIELYEPDSWYVKTSGTGELDVVLRYKNQERKKASIGGGE